MDANGKGAMKVGRLELKRRKGAKDRKKEGNGKDETADELWIASTTGLVIMRTDKLSLAVTMQTKTGENRVNRDGQGFSTLETILERVTKQ